MSKNLQAVTPPTQNIQYIGIPAGTQIVYQQERALSEPLTITNPVDGFYGIVPSPLPDCFNGEFISLSIPRVNSFLDNIRSVTTSNWQEIGGMITYMDHAGANAGTASRTDSILGNPCAPATGVESGECYWLVQGFNRQRLSGQIRDITDADMRFCELHRTVRVDGSVITDDFEWDVIRMANTLLKDFQYLFVNGSLGDGVNGLSQLVTNAYTDPVRDELCPAMNANIVDWNSNPMCGDNTFEPAGVTINGVAVTATGFDLIDLIEEWIEQVLFRVEHTSITGEPNFVMIMPSKHIRCLVDCWVCHTVCGCDIIRMDSMEAREAKSRLRTQARSVNGLILEFLGVPVHIYPYDIGLQSTDPLLPNDATIYAGVTNIGATPLIELQLKDMSNALERHGKGEFLLSDGNRFLSWETHDHTCMQAHLEMQWRLKLTGTWAWLRIDNVDCTGLFAAQSNDALADNFFGGQPPEILMPTGVPFVFS